VGGALREALRFLAGLRGRTGAAVPGLWSVRERLRPHPLPGVPAAPDPSARDDGAEVGPEARLLRRRWRELVKRIYEVGPLVCPRCQAEMRIVAFILDHAVIDTILRHLARREAERPSPAEGQAVMRATETCGAPGDC
jgi:hypothetical protein